MKLWLNGTDFSFPTHGALLTLNRQYLADHFEDDVRFTLSLALQKDNHYTLFRMEDFWAWVTFTAVFFGLILVDNAVMNRKMQAFSLSRAMIYSLFWVACAFSFCGGIYYWYGANKAAMWMSGYMLEWMLSFDNLFVFHMIFSVYQTPDHLKQKVLYLGICGAVFFRLAFLFLGEYLMHTMLLMHLVFGGFLVYTGVKTALVDDDDEDPSKHPIVQWLQRMVPFVSVYDRSGAFFVRIPVDENGKAMLPVLEEGNSPIANEDGKEEASAVAVVDFDAEVAKVAAQNCIAGAKVQRTQLRATMLLLVVICLEISDVLFAVDSVSAIVAQVNDLFLAYTSAVFAMLGLRASFFIIDELVKLFTLLKYGVANVLVFIGVKLMIGRFYHVPPVVVCVVLVTSIFGSMFASVAKDHLDKRKTANQMALEKLQSQIQAVIGADDRKMIRAAVDLEAANSAPVPTFVGEVESLEYAS